MRQRKGMELAKWERKIKEMLKKVGKGTGKKDEDKERVEKEIRG